MKTSHGSSVPRRLSATVNARCAGAWPGVETAVTTVFPSSTTSPSASSRWSKSTPACSGQVGGGTGSRDERRETGDVVGLNMCLEDSHDR